MAASKSDYIAVAEQLRPISRDVRRLQGNDPRRALFDEVLNAVCSGFLSRNGAFREETFKGYVHGECGPNGGTIK